MKNTITVREETTKTLNDYDLEKDVKHWEYEKNVEDAEDGKDLDPWVGHCNLGSDEEIGTYVKIVPKKDHNNEKVVEAKMKEIKKLNDFGALKVVEDVQQEM